MFDTHCHLNLSCFSKGLDQVIEEARQVGVQYILVPGTDIKTSQKATKLCLKYKNLYAAAGIHPHYADKVKSGKSNIDDLINSLESLMLEKVVVAVGEIGLDFHNNPSIKQVAMQKELFIVQFNLAIKYSKSVILHNREAKSELLPLLDKYWRESLKGKVVLHCCEVDQGLLVYAKERGFYIGVDGDVTYDKKKQDFVREIPIDRLVVETDSPFLLPEPLKIQRKYPNKPSNLKFIVQKIAEIKNLKFEEVARQTKVNAIRLFDI